MSEGIRFVLRVFGVGFECQAFRVSGLRFLVPCASCAFGPYMFNSNTSTTVTILWGLGYPKP